MTIVYLGLGSNIGNKEYYLKSALDQIARLPKTHLKLISPFYITEAWGKTDQDDFLNLVCQIQTELNALELLEYCQKIEVDLDRVRHEKWGPRTIDIDILLFGNELISKPTLKVPHPFMTERAFVLVPLSDIAPHDLQIKGIPLYQFLEKIDSSTVKRKD